MTFSKNCRLCKHTKQADEFYPDQSKSGGISTYCRDCTKLKVSKRYVKKGRPVLTDEERAARRKAAKDKYRESNRDRLRIAAKEYNNSEEGKSRGKDWRAKNPEKIITYRQEYYQDNIEKISEKSAQYYEKNPERVRARVNNRRITEPKKVNAEKAAGKAWRRSEEKLLSREERRDITAFYKYASKIGCQIDHIIPREKKGRHCLSNLQAIPATLNQQKSTKIWSFTRYPQKICCMPYYEGIKEEHLNTILGIPKKTMD